MDKGIEEIIKLGTLAPSGENCQPWRFAVRGNQISIFNIPERDDSLYSWGQRASCVAHGAVLENIVIASSAMGYEAGVRFFPDPQDAHLTAVVDLKVTAIKDEPLYSSISRRVTNRKPYKNTPLTDVQRTELLRTSQEVGGGKIMLEENFDRIKMLAGALSMNERILFENPALHSFFYRHISWTAQEDQQKRLGFYIKTLEIPSPALVPMKLAAKWSFMRMLNKINFSKFIAVQNAKVYASSSVIGAIVVPTTSREDFAMAGRLLQRLWLKLTQMGWSLQPLTGIPLLMLRVRADEIGELGTPHAELVKEMYEKITYTFGVSNGIIALCFRVGEGGEPSARSSRLLPDIQEVS